MKASFITNRKNAMKTEPAANRTPLKLPRNIASTCNRRAHELARLHEAHVRAQLTAEAERLLAFRVPLDHVQALLCAHVPARAMPAGADTP